MGEHHQTTKTYVMWLEREKSNFSLGNIKLQCFSGQRGGWSPLKEDDADQRCQGRRERLRPDGRDECGEHDEDQVTVEAESPQGRQYEGGEDRLGNLYKVSQGGGANGQATGSVCYLPIR